MYCYNLIVKQPRSEAVLIALGPALPVLDMACSVHWLPDMKNV